MKVVIALCAVLAVAAAFPQEYVAYNQQQQPEPPSPGGLASDEQKFTELAFDEQDEPEPPMPLLQELGELQQALTQVSVPYGLRSVSWKIRVKLSVYNCRSESVQWWWVNYRGKAVRYATIRSGATIIQYTYGTHPWLVTTQSGSLVGVYVPYTANADISIQNKASWN